MDAPVLIDHQFAGAEGIVVVLVLIVIRVRQILAKNLLQLVPGRMPQLALVSLSRSHPPGACVLAGPLHFCLIAHGVHDDREAADKCDCSIFLTAMRSAFRLSQ